MLFTRAHDTQQGDITCIKPLRNSNLFISRANQADDVDAASDFSASMKLWDLRNSREPVLVWKDASLCNFNQATNVTLSPNERIVLTGSSVYQDDQQEALLNCFDTLSGEVVCKEPVFDPGQSITVVNWCQATNQIFCGSSEGQLKVLYCEQKSKNGILDCLQRQPKQKQIEAFSSYNDE